MAAPYSPTVRTIERMGHPVLRATANPVPDPTAPAIQELVADMIETMKHANGAGLAAPQIGVSLRVVVFQAPASRVDPGLSEEEAFDHKAPLTTLINPVIEVLDATTEGGWEGCLSVPGLRGWVERPAHIRYSGFDLTGARIERVAKGFHARVVQVGGLRSGNLAPLFHPHVLLQTPQHECDHLDGTLYVDKLADSRRFIFESETRHWQGERFHAPIRPPAPCAGGDAASGPSGGA